MNDDKPNVDSASTKRGRKLSAKKLLGYGVMVLQLLVLVVIAGLIFGLIWQRRGASLNRQHINPVVPTTPAAAPAPAPTPAPASKSSTSTKSTTTKSITTTK